MRAALESSPCLVLAPDEASARPSRQREARDAYVSDVLERGLDPRLLEGIWKSLERQFERGLFVVLMDWGLFVVSGFGARAGEEGTRLKFGLEHGRFRSLIEQGKPFRFALSEAGQRCGIVCPVRLQDEPIAAVYVESSNPDSNRAEAVQVAAHTLGRALTKVVEREQTERLDKAGRLLDNWLYAWVHASQSEPCETVLPAQEPSAPAETPTRPAEFRLF